jgi:hypothetical protein
LAGDRRPHVVAACTLDDPPAVACAVFTIMMIVEGVAAAGPEIR